MRALRMAEGRHDLETEARIAARRIDVEQFAVQGLQHLGRLIPQRCEDLGIVREVFGEVLEVGMG